MIRWNGIPLVEDRHLGRDEMVRVVDPPMIRVRDVHVFRVRLELAQEIRDMFDQLRADLGLPIPDRTAKTAAA